MIEIKEDNYSNLAKHIEKALLHIGKVMQCLSEEEEENLEGLNTSYKTHRSSGRYSQY